MRLPGRFWQGVATGMVASFLIAGFAAVLLVSLLPYVKIESYRDAFVCVEGTLDTGASGTWCIQRKAWWE